MQRNRLWVFIVMTGMTVAPAFAYDPHGHQVIGEIADGLLDSAVKQQVTALIGMDLKTAATWTDCVKSVSPIPNTDPRQFSYPDAAPAEYLCSTFEDDAGKELMKDYAGRNWDTCKPKPGEEVCHRQYHYTDVAEQHDRYDTQYAGTSDHDIVSAINAAIAVLKKNPTPTPFNINGKREAILLLAHFVGDVHQPLHVGAVYLDAGNLPIDPEAPGAPALADSFTEGGNFISDRDPQAPPKDNLHKDWDQIPDDIDASAIPKVMETQARHVAPTPGDVSTWAATWATESIGYSHKAFAGLSYSRLGAHHWKVNFGPGGRAAYMTEKERMQREELLPKAGARLAALLNNALVAGPAQPAASGK